MDDNSRDLLLEAIVEQFDRLDQCEDEEERKKIIDNLSTLYRLKLDETRLDGEYERDLHKFEFDRKQYEDDKASKEDEKRYRDDQAREEKIDKYIEFGIKGGTTVLMIIAYDVWYRRGLKFEETGTVSTRMTQNLIGKLIPRF